MAERREIAIKVPVLTRVEGEGALELLIREGRIEDVKLRIYEPPRLFEKFLEGRSYTEVPDTVARICGICPVAYQMSAVQAIEAAFGVEVTPWVRDMRRLMYCGEWLQSHSLHIHLLAAPDFVGYDNAIAMAKDHPEVVRRGLRLQALGNDLIRLLGGRSVHPVGVCVGGFHRAPSDAEVHALRDELAAALADAEGLVAWCAGLALPEDDQAFVSVSQRQADAYPLYEGRLVSDRGLDIPIVEIESHIKEFQVPHSTALHARVDGQPFLVGPLARLNLNLDRLPEAARKALDATGVRFPSRNMFHSIVARAVEIHVLMLEAIRLLDAYQRPASSKVEVIPRAGTGIGCSEAPRGILWHRYDLDEQGIVRRARIVPPTSQNQQRIEEDLRNALEAFGLDRPEDALRLRGEMVIRNYDPCISCATHFLKLSVKRA